MNESEVRAWFREIGAVIAKGATITNTAIDDRVVGMFFQALDNELVWSLLWPVIDGMFEDKLMHTQEFDKAAAVAAIDPLTILAIVEMVLKLWKQFRR